MDLDAADPWDGYLIGPENGLAHAGARAIARGETVGVSPLVLFGPAGVGKSRLLSALTAEHQARFPRASRLHIAAEAFATACAEGATRPEGWADVRGRFRRLDLLVLDDLTTLERTPWVWEELGHTLDALDERGGAVVVTSRVAPGAWGRLGWPSRLVSRLTGGLALSLEPPGVESRRRYLLDQLRRRRLIAEPEAIEQFAEAADGYRTLDGWLTRLALLGRLDPRAGGLELVTRTLDLATDPESSEDTGRGGIASGPDLATVARVVAHALGVRVGDLRSASRHSSVAEARHLAIYLARRHTLASVRAIGAFFGGRDPATIRHADRTAARRLATDEALAALVEELSRSWSSTPVLRDRPPGTTPIAPPQPRGSGRG